MYDEFNEGNTIARGHPDDAALGHGASAPPAPVYLTLLGDGHFNMKGINPAIYGTAPDYVPPYLAFVTPVGEPRRYAVR